MSSNGTADQRTPASHEGEIVVDAVTKRFDDVTAVDAVSITIPGGEFFSMLGPSGCGKTTTLRMIAGFETPDAGRILLQGGDVTSVPPAKRNVNMVFQAYGLFPHMTVAENIAFGPKIKKIPRAEIASRMNDVIHTVRLDGLEDRRPTQLSGGQQQRVALARALINRPAALLLDEPLGALDLKLRKEMQLELKELQQRTETTFVYVTHDQEEAMTMSDRIAVMNLGVVEQLATPRELYQRPASAFVAGFIGTSNLIDLRVDRTDAGLLAMDLGDGERILAVDPGSGHGDGRATITVRPEWIKLANGTASDRASYVGGTVIDVVYLGSITQLIVLLRTGERLTVHRLNDEIGAVEPRPGESVMLRWAAEHSYIVGSSPAGEPGAASAQTPATPDPREGHA
jgi:spermidine/putrescine transport system ATP-binding protein